MVIGIIGRVVDSRIKGYQFFEFASVGGELQVGPKQDSVNADGEMQYTMFPCCVNGYYTNWWTEVRFDRGRRAVASQQMEWVKKDPLTHKVLERHPYYTQDSEPSSLRIALSPEKLFVGQIGRCSVTMPDSTKRKYAIRIYGATSLIGLILEDPCIGLILLGCANVILLFLVSLIVVMITGRNENGLFIDTIYEMFFAPLDNRYFRR